MKPNADFITQVTLDVSGEFLGEYVLVAGNIDGLSDGLIELRRPATDTRSYTSGVQRTCTPSGAILAVVGIYVLRLL